MTSPVAAAATEEAKGGKTQFLADVNILIVLKGLKGAQTRFAILTARAVERGATLMTVVPRDESIRLLVLTDLDYHPTLTHLDVKPDSSSAARLTLVRPDWLSECVKKRSKLPLPMYTVFVPTSGSVSSSSVSAVVPQMADASWSDHHYKPSYAHMSNAAAFSADLSRSARPTDAFHHSSDAGASVDDPAIASTSEHAFRTKLQQASSRTHLTVPRLGHSPASSSPHSTSAQSVSVGVAAGTARSPHARRVHFAPPSRMRESSPDDPLHEMLSHADDIAIIDSQDEDDGASETSVANRRRPREPFNETILRELEVIEQHARQNRDVHRANAYRNGIGTVRALGKPIYSLEDLRGATHFKPGGSLWMKVGEIIATGSLRRASVLRESPEFQLRKELSSVFGAGPAEVSHWIGAGVTSLAQLHDTEWCESHGIDLPHNVRIGLRYHADLQHRLTRDQVRAMVEHIETTVRAVVPNSTVVACGSYRRGAETSSDVDVMVTRKQGSDEYGVDGIMDIVLQRLASSGVVLATLTTLREDSERFLGICQLPGGPVARVDIYCTQQSEVATTLLHLTGSAEFNRAMARRARQLGLSLSNRGLRPVSGPKNAEVIGTPLELATEADIFRTLGVRWYEPHERSWVGLRDLDLTGDGAGGAGLKRSFAAPPPPTHDEATTRKRRVPPPPTVVITSTRKRAAFTDADCAPPLDDD